MSEKKLKTPYDYTIKEAVLSIDRLGASSKDIDVSNVIAQLDIFEDINRPFLLGNLVLNDDTGILSDINFIGTEKLNIKLGLPPTENAEPVTVNKNFIITQIVKSVKVNDEANVLAMEMIEDSGYRNYLENVNRPYTGTGSQIVSNCISEFVGKKLEIVNDGEASSSPFKIIVPNWNPFDVVTWVTGLMVKESGYPYYFYSTIHSDNIIQNNLLSMFEKPVVNPTNPFLYSTAASKNTKASVIKQAYTINDITFNQGLSTLNKVREGNVGSSTQQIDLIKNSSSREIIHFDVREMFKNAKTVGAVRSTQSYMTYDAKAKINDKNLHDYDSRRVSRLQVSYIYDKNTLNSTDVVPLDQVLSAKAIMSWMQASKTTIYVPGRNFLESSTQIPIKLGDTIAVNVLDPKNAVTGNEGVGEVKYNKKQSGEYIIQSLRHIFVLEKYSVVAECVKLTDIENNSEKL
jgi:hypothetical protein